MLKFPHRLLFAICLLANLAHASDSPSFQIGTMYAEKFVVLVCMQDLRQKKLCLMHLAI